MDMETMQRLEREADEPDQTLAVLEHWKRKAERRRFLAFCFNWRQVVDDPSTNSEPGLGSLHRRPRSGAGGHIPNTSSDRGTRAETEPGTDNLWSGTESVEARDASPLDDPVVAVPASGDNAAPTQGCAPTPGAGTGAAGFRDVTPTHALNPLTSGSRLPGGPTLHCSEAARISAANRHT